MVITSQFQPVQLPEQDLFSFIFKRKDRPFPSDHTIFQDVDTDKVYSINDVQRMAVDFGEGLVSLFNWHKGDVLALFVPNSIDIPGIAFGTLWAGGIVSPCNPGYTTIELTHQLKDSGARAIVTQLAVIDTVRAACSAVGIPEDHIILLGDDHDPSGRHKHWTNFRNLSGTQRYRQARINAKTDVAFLVYSSGTTGKPKGVMLSHYNLTSNVVQVQPSEQFNLTWDGSKSSGGIPFPPQGRGDKILACLPFFHIYGLTMFVLCPLHTGVTTLVMARFDIDRWCSLVQKHKATYAYIVPPIAVLLAKHPNITAFDLTSLRMTNSGGAPLNRDLVEAVYKRTGIRIKQGYGLSETSPGVCHQKWDDWLTSAGSVGWLLPNLEIKFCPPALDSCFSDSPKELGPGEVGELYFRGPNIFLGYHKNPSATKECLSPDGWFRTGDIGFMDGRGDVFITDRVKELIKYKGFQVAPAELEGYLLEHHFVADCAVVGVYSKRLQTEVPRAYIVKGSGDVTAGDAEVVTQWLNERVANYKRLRGGLKFVTGIPKSASGKVLRRILKEQAKADYSDDGPIIARI